MEVLTLPDLPARAADSHKGQYGSVLVVAGSHRYPGAAVLACLGAGRAGAGLVHLALPAALVPTVLGAVPFAIMHACDPDAEGGLTDAAAEPILAAAGSCDAVVLGPGLGTQAGTERLVQHLVSELSLPLVLDADALNLLALAGTDRLIHRQAATVLTPHPGEFARLSGRPAPRDAERVEQAAELALRLGVVVVLKGRGTVVTDGRRTRIETAGNPGMATGGTGDVLAGALGAFLAVLPDAAGAAALAVRVHARAGDLAAAELGPEAVLAQDVAERLGRALVERRLEGAGGPPDPVP